ncbi:MAG: hypothetical protein JW797_09855 [Bradymonadales bacterium]|nr:hypothetical protein [Bradymonadales bacterium]
MDTPCYPLSVEDYRRLPPDYTGPVYVWDIDKTYLATRFSSLRGMARIPIEFAIDKSAIEGMPAILRGLRRGPGPGFAASPLYFISASPPQLRQVIERKMLLDGVQQDGITFKDWVGTLRQLRPGRLKDHVGFKLCALLVGRRSRPMATEYLFGDDVEADAQVYSLYAEILDGRLSPGELERALVSARVPRGDRSCVLRLVGELPEERGKVGRILVHLERGTDPSLFLPFSPRLVPVHGALQMSLALYEMGLVDARTVKETSSAVGTRGRSAHRLPGPLIEDALIRGLVVPETVDRLRDHGALAP